MKISEEVLLARLFSATINVLRNAFEGHIPERVTENLELHCTQIAAFANAKHDEPEAKEPGEVWGHDQGGTYKVR